MKLLVLLGLITGRLCHHTQDVFTVHGQLGQTAVLPCPLQSGDVTWTRLTGSTQRMVLVTITGGRKEIPDPEKYGSGVNSSLIIRDVQASDYRMYFCNSFRVYLQAPETSAGPGASEPASESERGPEEAPPGGGADPGPQASPDFWKIPIGVLVGAALVGLVVLAMKLSSRRRAGMETKVDQREEVIYEEVRGVGGQPRAEPDLESRYYSTCTSRTPETPLLKDNCLYSTLDKEDRTRSTGQGGYHLEQQPGSASDL